MYLWIYTCSELYINANTCLLSFRSNQTRQSLVNANYQIPIYRYSKLFANAKTTSCAFGTTQRMKSFINAKYQISIYTCSKIFTNSKRCMFTCIKIYSTWEEFYLKINKSYILDPNIHRFRTIH